MITSLLLLTLLDQSSIWLPQTAHGLRELPLSADQAYRAAKPINEEKWLRRIAENYPSVTPRFDASGTVSLRVVVGLNGEVISCEILKSSTKAITDHAACKGMERYARFEVATNDQGRPTLSAYTTTITYKQR